MPAHSIKSEPSISVVMSVYNGANNIASTIESVLDQTHRDFEFIIVNDGSTDATPQILTEYGRKDDRIRLIKQPNSGLTQALINGCSCVLGEFIARQDVGDFSALDRLEKQFAFLCSDDTYNAVSSNVDYFSPELELMFTSEIHAQGLFRALSSSDHKKMAGPAHHGSVMFRTSHYKLVGGYRQQFYFAQDLDLWTRMIKVGQHGVVPETLYNAVVYPGAISSVNANKQQALKKIVAEMVAAGDYPERESELLAAASKIRPEEITKIYGQNFARGNYFIGSCLVNSCPHIARKYFRDCLRSNRLHLKAMYKWCRTWI